MTINDESCTVVGYLNRFSVQKAIQILIKYIIAESRDFCNRLAGRYEKKFVGDTLFLPVRGPDRRPSPSAAESRQAGQKKPEMINISGLFVQNGLSNELS